MPAGSSGSTELSVVIADDDPMVQDNLKTIIAAMPGITVVATASTGEEAIEATKRTQPDVVLMDLAMPVLDGVAATREITQRIPHVRVLALTALEDADRGQAAMAAGASSLLSKAVRRDLLEAAIRSTAAGLGVVSASATRQNWKVTTTGQTPRLTDPELETLRLVVDGLGNEEISNMTFSSLATVKKRILGLQRKHDTSREFHLEQTSWPTPSGSSVGSRFGCQ